MTTHFVLVWLVAAFWLGLLMPIVTSFNLLIAALMAAFAAKLFKIRWGAPKRYLVAAVALGSLFSPGKEAPPLVSRPWNPINATLEVLDVHSAETSHQLPLWCKIVSIEDSWGRPLLELNGYELLAKLPEEVAQKHGHLKALRWQVMGQVKINASGKPKIRVHQASADPSQSITDFLKLQMLRIHQRWSTKLVQLTRSGSPMGSNLLLSMLGAEHAKTRVDYVLRRLGLSHLLAISGLHFTLVASLAALLTTRLKTPWRLIATLLASSLFLIACQPSPSSLRAWSMSLIATWCLFTGRQYSAIHALSLVSLFWLFIHPTWCRQPGFILSVYCTAILIAIAPFLKAAPNAVAPPLIRSNLIKWLALQGSLFLLTAPLQLYWFHTLSWISLLGNLLLAPLIGLLFSLALAASLLCLFVSPLGGFFLNLLCSISEEILELVSHLPHQLDQSWLIELSPFGLACCMPWALACWFKLLQLQAPPTWSEELAETRRSTQKSEKIIPKKLITEIDT